MVVRSLWPLYLMVWWCEQTFFRQCLISRRLEQAPRAFLACSLCCWQWKQAPWLPPSLPALSPYTYLDLNSWSREAPRCWLCWATRAGRAPITLMCLFMFAHCWAARRLLSQVCTTAHMSAEAAPVTAEVTFSEGWQVTMEGTVVAVRGNIMKLNTYISNNPEK